jgi:hypoxanthine phosphoribosyltransferase
MMQAHISMLYSPVQIQTRIRELAREMASQMDGDPVLVCLLRGSVVFTADLARALHDHGVALRMEFMALSSYGDGTESSGAIKIHLDCREPLHGRDVLLVDDILDTGRTLAFAATRLREQGAERVKTAVLLDKPERRIVAMGADYVGFTIPNAFVVGYGLDFAGRFRELPYVGILENSEDLG